MRVALLKPAPNLMLEDFSIRYYGANAGSFESAPHLDRCMSKAFEARPDSPAIHTLLRLHADLAGKVQANKEQREKLLAQVAAVETVIRLFDPAFEMRKISARRRVTGNPWFKRGECFRHALDVLREATAPLTTTEIVRAMLPSRA
jgi:hypothetical protein